MSNGLRSWKMLLIMI